MDGEQQLRTGCLGAGRAAAGLEVLGAVGGQHRSKTAITRELVIDERGGFQRDVRLAQAAAEAARVLAADAWVDAAMSRVDGHNDFAVRRLLCHGGDLLLATVCPLDLVRLGLLCRGGPGALPLVPEHRADARAQNQRRHRKQQRAQPVGPPGAVDVGFFPRGCTGPCHGRPPFRLRFLNDTIVM